MSKFTDAEVKDGVISKSSFEHKCCMCGDKTYYIDCRIKDRVCSTKCRENAYSWLNDFYNDIRGTGEYEDYDE